MSEREPKTGAGWRYRDRQMRKGEQKVTELKKTSERGSKKDP